MVAFLVLALVTPGDSVPAGWIDLTNVQAWEKPSAEWAMSGGATLDPENNRRLTILPGSGALVPKKGGRAPNLVSRRQFADVEVHLEFLLSRGSNSGIKLMGLYEIQLFNSHGRKKWTASDCGGIYPRAENEPSYHHIDEGTPPRINAALPAGQWQTLDIVFQAPRFDAASRKTAPARFVKVVLNDKLIHENVPVPTPTGSAWRLRKETPRGPLLLQGDHGPVAFRRVWVRVKDRE